MPAPSPPETSAWIRTPCGQSRRSRTSSELPPRLSRRGRQHPTPPPAGPPEESSSGERITATRPRCTGRVRTAVTTVRQQHQQHHRHRQWTRPLRTVSWRLSVIQRSPPAIGDSSKIGWFAAGSRWRPLRTRRIPPRALNPPRQHRGFPLLVGGPNNHRRLQAPGGASECLRLALATRATTRRMTHPYKRPTSSSRTSRLAEENRLRSSRALRSDGSEVPRRRRVSFAREPRGVGSAPR